MSAFDPGMDSNAVQSFAGDGAGRFLQNPCQSRMMG